MADYFGVTTDYLLGREDERAHGNEAFRQDNANFKRRYDALPKELRAVISSTFDSVYVLLSRCMNAQNAAEMALYRELFSELQTGRGEIKSILADCGETWQMLSRRLWRSRTRSRPKPPLSLTASCRLTLRP